MCVCTCACVYFPLANIYQVPAVCQALCESLGAWGQSTDGQRGIPPYGGGPPFPFPPLPMASPGALVHAAGCRVRIPAEVLILNSIVLPHKELSRSFTNQIIL